ncbi:glycosyltransferase [Alkaliphilus peptidifermentans]|uniref:Glycosyltransferase involved in cell wall bisynthesis n=1 Tax=Alkaliphilus peptidifermentans DSM 18978 TaxID=1120976 RepID=A0A1G5H0H5_9FIRM|nr:glycosyltransferase family 2 protein [Alkaliphilus peptidifermentans]SCY57355.1 Glycosyltransferase involved in cell wall bisynthesis [Alkaliphilus peptidifermentans DSM 18978]
MISISLCMIVKNEEEILARCLDTVNDIVDEINIVDTGSTDKTKEVAGQYTDRIFDFEWIDNFAAARNESFKYATKDYILYLDADDVLLEKDRIKLKELKETLDPSVDSVSMYYDAGTDEFGNVTLRYRRNRLVKREKNYKWMGDCHQYLDVRGHIINSDIAITHKKIRHAVGRTVSIYEKKIERGDTFTARDFFYYGNELRENGKYEKAIENYNKNISMKEGWIEDKIFACIFKGDCYRYLGDMNNELLSLFQSFQLSSPRAEACSRIGYNFQKQRDYKTAAFWYELSIQQVPDPDRWSFIYLAYYTWYPHLQLCVCYYNLKEYQKSYDHNELARKYRPEDKNILQNKILLERILKSGKN